MATSEITSAHEARPAALTVDTSRADLAYRATTEIDALARMLARESALDQDELDLKLNFATGLNRIHRLASVVLSVLCDDRLRGTAEMHEVVHHEPIAVGHG